MEQEEAPSCPPTMTPDGFIALVTSTGRVAVVGRHSGPYGEDFRLAASLRLAGTSESSGLHSDAGSVEVSNSLAVDELGGVYVATSEALCRVQWTRNASGETLTLDWTAPYGSEDSLWPGRLGHGTGSTPSLMRVAGGGRTKGAPASELYALLTDGASPMRLLAVRARDGRVTGNATCTFGQGDESEAQQSTSEQSVVVHGGRAAVVQNWIDKEPWVCRTFGYMLPGKLSNACPFLLGTMPRAGVQQFRLDPDTGALEPTWTNKQVQCSSSIPAVAPTENMTPRTNKGGEGADEAVFYCLGMRPRPRHKAPQPQITCDAVNGGGGLAGMLGAWGALAWGHVEGGLRSALEWLVLPGTVYTVEAIDWRDGRSKWVVELPSGSFVNPNYAAIQVGPEGDLLVGTLGGVLRVSPLQDADAQKRPPVAPGAALDAIGDEEVPWVVAPWVGPNPLTSGPVKGTLHWLCTHLNFLAVVGLLLVAALGSITAAMSFGSWLRSLTAQTQGPPPRDEPRPARARR
mmetsp:Transcript_36714/g.82257  ORF Transcript_36714/g.82257 Transcript_36714/m.82257 type:complete len:516 (+) Transcript_36714:374-1921(+)